MRRIAWTVVRACVVAGAAISLVACGGATGPTQVDVAGFVLGQGGVGVAGASVVVGDRAPVTTDAEGRFAFDGVTVPYDLVVFSGPDAWAHVFEGVSTATPSVVPFAFADGGLPPDAASAGVVGDLSAAVPVNHVAIVCAESVDRAVAGCTAVDAGFDAFELDVAWIGAASVDVTVRAVVFELDGFGTSVGVASMGATDVTVADGDALGPVAIALAPVPSETIDVTIVAPVAWSVESAIATTRQADRFKASFVPVGSPPTLSFAVDYPSFAGAEAVLFARASAVGAQSWAWRIGMEAGQAQVLTLPAPPAAVRPVDGAVGVTVGDALEVEATPGASFLYLLQPDVDGTGPVVAITTTKAEVAIPDLAAFDAALAVPAAVAYDWRVGTLRTEAPADVVGVGGDVLGWYTAAMDAFQAFVGAGPPASASFTIGPASGFTFE